METAMIQTTEFVTTQPNDPREAKLRGIIEKGKSSLHKTLEEIQHEFSIREDMAVRPTAIDFLDQDDKIQIMKRSVSISYAMLHALCAMLFSGGMGWLTWKQFTKILEIIKGHFGTDAERKFVEDLIVYLDYKIREAERIRYERKQMSFW